MKILIRQSLTRTIIFFAIEVILCVLSMYLISENFETTANQGRDIILGVLFMVLSAILIVWIVGFIHLRSIGYLHHFKRACIISFIFTLLLLVLSAIWNSLFILTLLAPAITFNIVVLRQNIRLLE